MIQIKGLNIAHKKDLRPLLENFSFVLSAGDKAVIIGEEGNGKSTLLKLIYDSALVEDYAEWSGEIITRDRLGILFQEMPAEDREKPIWEYFAALPDFYDIPQRELAETARKLGLPGDICYSGQLISTLSGGEKVKLQLCRVLLQKPDVLLLDEPSNDIDIAALRWLEDFINSCKLPVLFISHDETLIERTANVIIHIELVRRKTLPRFTIAKMSYRQYMAERASSLAYQEQQARKEQSEYEKQQAKYLQIMQKVEHQQNIISRGDPSGARLLKKKMHAVKSMGRRFEREKENMTKMPQWEHAILTFFDKELSTLPAGKDILRLDLPELCAGDARGDFAGGVPAERAVLLPADDERGRGDLHQAIGCVMGQAGVGLNEEAVIGPGLSEPAHDGDQSSVFAVIAVGIHALYIAVHERGMVAAFGQRDPF